MKEVAEGFLGFAAVETGKALNDLGAFRQLTLVQYSDQSSGTLCNFESFGTILRFQLGQKCPQAVLLDGIVVEQAQIILKALERFDQALEGGFRKHWSKEFHQVAQLFAVYAQFVNFIVLGVRVDARRDLADFAVPFPDHFAREIICRQVCMRAALQPLAAVKQPCEFSDLGLVGLAAQVAGQGLLRLLPFFGEHGEHPVQTAMKAFGYKLVEIALFQQVNVEITQPSGRCHQSREPGLELLGLILVVDALEQAQNRADLAQGDAVVMQELGIDIRYDPRFIRPGDRDVGGNDIGRRVEGFFGFVPLHPSYQNKLLLMLFYEL